MAEPISKKKLIPFWLKAIFFAAIAVVGLVMWRLGGTKTFAAQAQVALIAKGAVAPDAPGVEVKQLTKGQLATHMVLLRSPSILDQAVKKQQLQNLKSLEKATDLVEAITKMMRVEGSQSTDSPPIPILAIECRGPVAEDCETIVRAVIGSYQDWLALTFKDGAGLHATVLSPARAFRVR